MMFLSPSKYILLAALLAAATTRTSLARSTNSYALSNIMVSVKIPSVGISTYKTIHVSRDFPGTICIKVPITHESGAASPEAQYENIYVTTYAGGRIQVGMLFAGGNRIGYNNVYVSTASVGVRQWISKSVIYGIQSRAAGMMIVTADAARRRRSDRLSSIKAATRPPD